MINITRDNCCFHTCNWFKLSWYQHTQPWTVSIFNIGRTPYTRFAILVVFWKIAIFVHWILNIGTQTESIYLLLYQIYSFCTLIYYNGTFTKSSSVLMSPHNDSSLSGCPHTKNVGDFGGPSLHQILVRFILIVWILFRFNQTLVGLLTRRNT